MLEEGQLIDGKGREVNFRQSVIIMTSNLGADLIKKTSIGFTSPDQAEKSYERMKTYLTAELKNFFRPEFINRLDKIVNFKSLDKNIIRGIAKVELKKLERKLAIKKIKLAIKPELVDFLVEKGYSEEYGARPMRRCISENVEDPLSEEILKGQYQKGSTVSVTLKDNQDVFN